MPQPNYITGLSYGPIKGEFWHDAMYGPTGRKLGTYDVAAGADILKQHPIGSSFIYNGQTYTVADPSFAHGAPTGNTLEFRDTANNQRINPADIQWLDSPSGGGVSFNWLNQQSSEPTWEWNPKEGGLLGKIGARMPGASTYLAGQSLFDLVRGLFTPKQGGGAAPADTGIPANLQPTSPGYSFAPGFGPPGDPNAPAPYQPPPWVMPPTQEFGGPGFGAYAQAQNAFIPSLINWNGPGQANPTGREPGLFEDASAKWLAQHNVGAGWWNPGRGGGRGGGGPMPVNFQ
jgi:hypothetical protein